MKINYNKIINIKKIKDLNNYNINKPLYNNNYLFHYLILLNNLEGLKLIRFPIYIENNYNLNGIHLAAHDKNFKILYYLIENYNEYIYNKNIDDYTFVDFLDINDIIKLIKKYNNNIKWKYLLNNNILKELLYKTSYKNILVLLKFPFIKNFNLILYSLIRNNNINENELINIFNLYTNKKINYLGYIYSNFIHYIIQYRPNNNIIKYLIERKFIFDMFDSRTRKSIIDICIEHSVDINVIELLINYILKTDNKYYKKQNNFYLNNIIHIILINRINDFIDDSFTIKILNKFKNSNSWHQVNIFKLSPLEIILNLNFNIYSKIIIDNNIHINLKLTNKIINYLNKKEELLKENNLYDNYIKWINLYKSLPNYNIKKNYVITKKYKYARYNLFSNLPIDILLFTICIYNKYNNLYLPMLNNNNINYNLTIDNINFFSIPNQIYPWIIYYDDLSNNFFIHSNLNILINIHKNKYSTINKRFGFLFLSINYHGSYHANIIIYDFKNMIIERFEPYGYFKNDNLDKILEEELTWNTNFKYYKPKYFMNSNGFQSVSDETNNSNIKSGDIGGFCLAWCFWYLESKILNENVKSKTLVKLLFNKINNSEYKFSEYIRNYANNLNKQKNKILLNIGINKNHFYNKIYNNNKIYDYINHFFYNLSN